MKKTLHSVLVLMCLLTTGQLKAQNFTALYDFGSVNSTSGRTDPTPVPTIAGLACGSFTAFGTGLSANPNASGRFSFTGWDLGASNGLNTFTGSINLGKYYEVTLTPQAYYSLDLDSITFTLQRSGTGIRQYSVRSSIDGYAANLRAVIEPANDDLQVVATNVFQVSDGTSSLENGSKIDTLYKDLSSPITFRFYGFNAESSGGTFSIDNVRFYGTTTLSPTAPNINPSTANLNFPATGAGGNQSVLTYTLSGTNLSSAITLSTATTTFTIADNAAGPFSNNLVIAAADLVTNKTIYVKFSPAISGSFKDTILHTGSSASPKKVALAGDGIITNNLTFDFNSCIDGAQPGSGFTAYSTTGAQAWVCTSFGRNTSNGVNINGFSGGAQENEDWLISPPLQISSLNLPVLRFWSKGEFSGLVLQLLISTNYTGTGDPNLATWTNANASFPMFNNTWTLTDGIDLTAYKAAANVYVAFKYHSSVEDGAARWTIDDVDVSNRSNLFTTNIEQISFGEASAGTSTEAKRVAARVLGYGDVTVTAPNGYQLSLDSTTYSSFLNFSEAVISNTTDFFVRFAPTSQQLKIEGSLKFTGAGLDSMKVQLTGTSYPKAETFDAGCYNLSFFGSNPTNNPTAAKIALQVANIATVFNRLKLDIVGVSEVSSEVAMDSLVSKLPNHKYVLSPRWSYSFDAPDPNFPPQKIGFLYDSLTSVLIETRAMFTGLYDSVRNGFPDKLPLYPGGTPQSFWASGRLPYMGTFDVTIEGITKRIRVVVIHAKSASDAGSYNRRVYDVQVLKDSLDAYYANDIVMLVGDYNDRVSGSIYTGSPNSPYLPFVNDAGYDALTLPLDVAGRVSFIGGSGLIDHVIISNEFVGNYISNSTDIEDPRSYISGYNATTASDHLPVYSRFQFATVLPVTLVNLNASARQNDIVIRWQTSNEVNAQLFQVEKSIDGVNFKYLTQRTASGYSNGASYEVYDFVPVAGRNFYRLKQFDIDGKFYYSAIVFATFGAKSNNEIKLFPNPVTNAVSIVSNSASDFYSAKFMNSTGKISFVFKGSLYQLNQQLNKKLSGIQPGVYILQLNDGSAIQNLKFIKN